jgi:hypothetical protein
MLLMAPAAYHRIVYDGEDTEEMHRTGSVLVTAAALPLAIGLSGDIYVVMAKIAGSGVFGAVCGGSVLVLLLGLWYGFPLAVLAWRRRHGKTAQPPHKAQRQPG